MVELVSVGVLIAILVVAFATGRHTESALRGILLFSLPAMAFIGLGFFGMWWDGRSDKHQLQGWTTILLVFAIIFAIALELIGLAVFGIGRLSSIVWPPRRRSGAAPVAKRTRQQRCPACSASLSSGASRCPWCGALLVGQATPPKTEVSW